MKITIENDVPLQDKKQPRVADSSRQKLMYAIAGMEVGQSFKIGSQFKTTCYNLGYELNRQLCIRKWSRHAVRVWRVA